MEISRQRLGRERPDIGNAGAGERQALPGAEAVNLYRETKTAELARFKKLISAEEYAWYL